MNKIESYEKYRIPEIYFTLQSPLAAWLNESLGLGR